MPAKSPPRSRSSSTKLSTKGASSRSLAKAKGVFKKFSLSKFANGKLPSNHVATGQSTKDTQRKSISRQLNTLSNADAPPRALTIALADATIKQFLPSLDVKSGTVDLSELMSFIQRNMRGTEFYSYGNPTLNRLAVNSQVQDIIDSIKREGKK